MKPILSPEAMASADKAAEASGIPVTQLMENAGEAVARQARQLMGSTYGRRITIVCGKGNNAGDGFVAARRLKEWGATPVVAMMHARGDLNAAALTAYESLRGVRTLQFEEGRFRRLLQSSDLVIDAMVGTGFKGELQHEMASAASVMQESHVPVLAVDVPSGVSAATGRVEGRAVMADATVALGALKHGLLLLPGRSHCGAVRVVDIGIPPEMMVTDSFLVEAGDVAGWLPPRKPDAHKRSVGKVLIVAGSAAMPGAATLSGLGALRMGAGLVRIAVPDSISRLVGGMVPEALVSGLPENSEGGFEPSAVSPLAELAEAVEAVVVGPGIGKSDETAEFLFKLMAEIDLPFVIDADAISLIAGAADSLAKVAAKSIITPHEGEIARVLGTSPKDVAEDRMGSVKRAAAQWRTTVLLKGSHTLICEPGESRLFFSPAGGPVLATAGSGDVLAGIIGALLAQVPATQAGLAGAYVHGAAGDLLSREVASRGVTARDIADAVPRVIASIEKAAEVTGR